MGEDCRGTDTPGGNRSTKLLKLERKLQNDLEEVLKQEELLLFQRSREEWIISGDRNTKFYHASTQIRKNKNKIHTLKSTNGQGVTEPKELEDMVQDFYKGLFREDTQCTSSETLCIIHPKLTDKQRRMLELPFSKEDIKRALFDIAPFKAQGKMDCMRASTNTCETLWEFPFTGLPISSSFHVNSWKVPIIH